MRERRLCSICHEKNARRGQFTCADCHSGYMKETRAVAKFQAPARGRPAKSENGKGSVACTRHPEAHATTETRTNVYCHNGYYGKDVRRRKLCRTCKLRWTDIETGLAASKQEFKEFQDRQKRRRRWEHRLRARCPRKTHRH